MEASTRKAIASHSVGCGVSVDIAEKGGTDILTMSHNQVPDHDLYFKLIQHVHSINPQWS